MQHSVLVFDGGSPYNEIIWKEISSKYGSKMILEGKDERNRIKKI